MALKTAVVVLLVIGVPARDESTDDSKKVMENLQGEWQMVRADVGNEPPPPDAKIGQTRMTIQGTKLIIGLGGDGGGGRREPASFSVDLSKKPYAIDIRPELPKEFKDMVVKGIFQLNGETLQLVFGRPGSDRPTSFTPTANDRFVSLTFERVRPPRPK